MTIKFIERKAKKLKPNPNRLGFGKYFTDYLFEMEYHFQKGWNNPTIKPYKSLRLKPAAMVLHYGQAVFEGLKAYKNDEGEITLFRPHKNIERLNKSCQRLCIPELDEKEVMEALTTLLKVEKDWIPTAEGTSLYIRPFIIATDSNLGVYPSHSYKFLILLSPVGAYYAEGFNPVKIYVEQHFVRAVRGGMGEAKTAGNYAAGLKAQTLAKQKGFSQVLWLDGVEKKYIEEVGTMNVFFVLEHEVITPELNGSILEGVTRSAVIQLLKDFGYRVTERKIAMEEILQLHQNGALKEVFGTGTAAVISPVGEMWLADQQLLIHEGNVGPVSLKLYDQLTKIQTGKIKDPHHWTWKI